MHFLPPLFKYTHQRVRPRWLAKGCRLATTTLACLMVFPAVAQIAPDAGQTLQELAPPPVLPPASPTLDLQGPPLTEAAPGGPTVTLQQIAFQGNTVFDQDTLFNSLGDVKGQAFDLAGLRHLANQVSQYYRDNGYPFARAFLPPQTPREGLIVIQVMEGRYGQVQAIGDESLIMAAQTFLAPLKNGDVIESDTLERTTLLLSDLPGIEVSPLIRPGKEPGTGDLDVKVSRAPLFSGDVGLDNQGNRYTGEYRARLNMQFDSPFFLGDQITLRSMISDENLWLGSLGYSAPLGSSGLRGLVSYSHTDYELAKEFSNLQASGLAKVTSLGLTYPLLRSQRANVTLGASWQHKSLEDRQKAAGSLNNKSSQTLPLSVQFDLRDGVLGGGVTYGSVTWTAGRLWLDEGLRVSDQATAKTRGAFNKFNLDLARLQALPAGLVGFARVSAQWSNKNLDSSEDFGLGGPYGVRAYPVGEGYGDEGWLGQLELRYPVGVFTPYAFYDIGRVKLNRSPWDETATNYRSVSGAGFGVRVQHKAWTADAVVAWKGHGGKAESDSKQRDPRFWVTVGFKF